MSIFTSYIFLLCPINLICTMLLRYFGIAFIYHDLPRMFGGGFNLAVGLTLGILSLVSAISWFVCRPSDLILNKVKKENYVPTENEISMILGCSKRLNIITNIVCFTGYFLGQVVMIAVGIKNKRYDFDLLRITVILAQSVGFGAVTALGVINGLDVSLGKIRELLGIHALDEKYKKYRSQNTTFNIFFTTAVLIFFLSANFYSVVYGAPLAKNHSENLVNGIICYVISFLCMAYPFATLLVGLRSRMKAVSTAMIDISDRGDLSKRIAISMLDDFGDLTTSINKTMDSLSGIIQTLHQKSGDVLDSAEIIEESSISSKLALVQMTEILSRINENSNKQNDLIIEAEKNIYALTGSVENVKKHVSQQSDSVQNISSSVSQMTANIVSVAETARKAQLTSDKLNETSINGGKAIVNAIATMNSIQESSEKVQAIVKIIKSIANQTNLLSMNAAIEAAHAGQFGAGFAVVADEVRKLAEDSSKSATEIQNLISEMAEKITNGVKVMSVAGVSFKDVENKVSENAEFVNTISAAMEEQKIGAEETQNSTLKVVELVHSVNDLANEENEAAVRVKNFMATVVDASKSSLEAVKESVQATEHLKDSFTLVEKSAQDNKTSVADINQHLSRFST